MPEEGTIGEATDIGREETLIHERFARRWGRHRRAAKAAHLALDCRASVIGRRTVQHPLRVEREADPPAECAEDRPRPPVPSSGGEPPITNQIPQMALLIEHVDQRGVS